MSGRYPAAMVATLVVLLAINLWLWPNPSLQRSTTSFGVGREGYKAAYDLLSELGLPVTRSYLRISQVSKTQPLWMVMPSFLTPAQAHVDTDVNQVNLLKWVRSGGTVVVFGGLGSSWEKLGIKRATQEGGESSGISGDLVRGQRKIDVTGLLHFSAAGSHARVVMRSGGEPFALEVPIGAGRLIAVADGRFMLNANLAQADSAPLVFDLARALGAPAFEERCHGLAPPVSLIASITASRAVVPLLLGSIAALSWVAEQRRWPRRTLAEPDQRQQPSIGAFVESLGELYSRANDPQAVFRAYRSGFLHRLAREMSPRGDLSEERVITRLARDPSLSGDTRRWLVEGASPRDQHELLVAVRTIESYPKIG
jgi:hypothetical protein